MMLRLRSLAALGGGTLLALGAMRAMHATRATHAAAPSVGGVTVNRAARHDVSAPLPPSVDARDARATDIPPNALAPDGHDDRDVRDTVSAPAIVVPAGAASIEQRSDGTRPGSALVASFDGLGADFVGPQGTARLRNPSDNSLAVGPNHIVQIVNTRMAIYTRKGAAYDTTGRVLYGPVGTNNVFRGFGGPCEADANGDAVVRYDQLANRWLVVMPIFTRSPERAHEPEPPVSGGPAVPSEVAHPGQPGGAVPLYQPPLTHEPPFDSAAAAAERARRATLNKGKGSYAMCYAVSTTSDPMGSYYRYEFTRPLFPDYPRPAIWPDGYYVPTSTGDEVIQKHACVADRARMLKGEDATEQCVIVDGVNFLNNADLDGTQLPPRGAPNIVVAGGGTQLEKVMEDSAIYVWQYHVDWIHPANTKLVGPVRIAVAPYHYLCDGQLTSCVPQPGTDRRLDAQGDKLMARLVYRRIGRRESVVAVHSVNTSEGGGGVRWYELRVDPARSVSLYQQGTYAPDSGFRWLGSAAIDGHGNIGIGYSYGSATAFVGQRFAGRLSSDPRGELTLREVVLAQGEGAQTSTLRWEDYTQTGVDPSDDCTIWYVGDYYHRDATAYSTRIGAFRMPGCTGK